MFEGLYIYDKWNWEDKYPVIHISFSGDLRNTTSFIQNINSILNINKLRLELTIGNYENYSDYFRKLVYTT